MRAFRDVLSPAGQLSAAPSPSLSAHTTVRARWALGADDGDELKSNMKSSANLHGFIVCLVGVARDLNP